MSTSDETTAAATLLGTQRWAALASLGGDGRPHASMVAYALEPDLSAVYLHLSRLAAAHTGNLLAAPDVSLAVTEPDPGQGDPQTIARITLEAWATEVPRQSEAYRPRPGSLSPPPCPAPSPLSATALQGSAEVP